MENKYIESSEFYSKRFNNFSTLIIIPVGLVVLMIFIFSFFGEREITIDGMGSIEPIQNVSIIQSASNNFIKKNNLNEGKLVHKNDVLLIYKDGANDSGPCIIKAPKSGVLHLNYQYKNAKYVPFGNEIAKIYPLIKNEKYVTINAFVSTNEISSIETGQKIRFKVTRSVPKPIILDGTIKTVSVAPINIYKNTYYLVTSIARINPKINKLLKYGMSGSMSVLVGEKSFFNYYKDKIINKDN